MWQVVTGAQKRFASSKDTKEFSYIKSKAYVPDFGAAYYVAKYITKSVADFDIMTHGIELHEFDMWTHVLPHYVKELPPNFIDIPSDTRERVLRVLYDDWHIYEQKRDAPEEWSDFEAWGTENGIWDDNDLPF